MEIVLRKFKHWLGNVIRRFIIITYRKMGIEIGQNTMISLGAKLDLRRGKISIGNNVTITHGVVILSHDFAATKLGSYDQKHTIIEDNSFIGVNSVILPGVIIGHNSIIGAGSVVTKNIPPYSLVVGNPAKVIKNLAKSVN
jgi:acetyltransferase-like isoleucine patch superfamily enzyme